MHPPIFAVCASAPAVQAMLGTDPTRLYPFGEAPQGTQFPYAVWQIIGGSPENYLAERPDVDFFALQLDVYAADAGTARGAAAALRDVIEPYAHIVAWRGESRDSETKSYRVSFDLDWFVSR